MGKHQICIGSVKELLRDGFFPNFHINYVTQLQFPILVTNIWERKKVIQLYSKKKALIQDHHFYWQY